MTETQVLLSKIAALRQRLEQAHGLALDAGSAAAALLKEKDAVEALKRKIETGNRHQAMLDTTLRQLPGAGGPGGDGASMPTQLTSRAARLLRRAHDLLAQLRVIADDALLPTNDGEPAALLYRETVSMTDSVLRTVQAFPEAPSAQIRLCEGLEAVLNVVADRLATLTATLQQRRREAVRRNSLAELLTALADGHSIEAKSLTGIAEAVHEDVLQGEPLQFPDMGPHDVPLHVAAHSLAVAQVIGRLTRHDPEWRGKPLEPIIAALVHDVGMLKVPAGVLRQETPLKDEHRRMIEAHPLLGADLAARVTPSNPGLVEAAGQHHERLDGTGYPHGLRELQVKPLVRLLAVCDMYAAMCQPRAWRAALDPRTALTDTLLAAEKGGLDRGSAERLLLLSFYPVGSVVELSDGAMGIVVATHQGRRDLNTPARPVVALLTDSQGQFLPTPRHVDLAEVEGRTIVRTLPAADRRDRLGKRYPDLAA
jgi:HD-GYP domain-containing protein (c-di-GMP phosphodiesterase class II)